MTAYVLALCLLLMIPYCQSENPQQFTSTLYKATNRALQSHVFHWKTVSSLVICGRDCTMDPQCASFNYQTDKHVCEFNNITRANSPEDFIKSQGSVYFDERVDTLSFGVPNIGKVSSCLKLYQAGYRDNGINTIYPTSLTDGIQVYCDMETDGGGWIVFQRRQDGSVDFYRNWTEYQSGFGDLQNEFWLGNDILRDLTGSGQWQLRVDMEDWDSETAWASYGSFAVTGSKYTLMIGLFDAQSTAADSLESHNRMKFTTKDQQNDWFTENCAVYLEGAWWFRTCHTSDLNGKYYRRSKMSKFGQGLQWIGKKDGFYSFKKCSMKVREVI